MKTKKGNLKDWSVLRYIRDFKKYLKFYPYFLAGKYYLVSLFFQAFLILFYLYSLQLSDDGGLNPMKLSDKMDHVRVT